MWSAFVVFTAIFALDWAHGFAQPLKMSGTGSSASSFYSSEYQSAVPQYQPPSSPFLPQPSNYGENSAGCFGGCLPAAAAKILADSGIGLSSDATSAKLTSGNTFSQTFPSPQYTHSQNQPQYFSQYPPSQYPSTEQLYQASQPNLPNPSYSTSYNQAQTSPQYGLQPQQYAYNSAYSGAGKMSNDDAQRYSSTSSFGSDHKSASLCFPICPPKSAAYITTAPTYDSTLRDESSSLTSYNASGMPRWPYSSKATNAFTGQDNQRSSIQQEYENGAISRRQSPKVNAAKMQKVQ